MPVKTTKETPFAPAFADRHEAGRLLARMVGHLKESSPVVLALPRGGVPLGYEVAKELEAPLDLVLVRKIAVPGHPEESLGVVAEGGSTWIDEANVEKYHVHRGELDEMLLKEQEEVERQAWRYRQGRPRLDVQDRTVLVVDDGVATGRTARWAIEEVRKNRPAHVLLGVGVISPEAYPDLFRFTDGVYCPLLPASFGTIGGWYRTYEPVEDPEIEKMLNEIHHMHDQDALPPAPKGRPAAKRRSSR
jgi:putative phosphoribosyl transferase